MRVYLDHNATTPLRAEARAAMGLAMDVTGNPSSVHAEGRAAKAVIERARGQVAALVGADPAEVVFCGSATEAAAQVLAAPWSEVCWSGVEHDCIAVHAHDGWRALPVDADGRVAIAGADMAAAGALIAVQGANSETGVMQDIGAVLGCAQQRGAVALIDAVQMAGKVALDISALPKDALWMISAHKLGGPKGVGALIVPRGFDLPGLIKGGGQEMGRRSGTENVVGIAGFGAAAEAAAQDISAGRWEEVAELRNILETSLEAAAKPTIFVGKGTARLPNTSCIIAPGWKGETQVMQMDLAGFAVSAGSACSSGKVKVSKVLQAMRLNDDQAGSALRVSLGLETTKDEVLRFADLWQAKLRRHQDRAQ